MASSLPNGSFAVQVDVASVDSVKKCVNDVLQKTRQIDILVNNAGIAGPSGLCLGANG